MIIGRLQLGNEFLRGPSGGGKNNRILRADGDLFPRKTQMRNPILSKDNFFQPRAKFRRDGVLGKFM